MFSSSNINSTASMRDGNATGVSIWLNTPFSLWRLFVCMFKVTLLTLEVVVELGIGNLYLLLFLET